MGDVVPRPGGQRCKVAYVHAGQSDTGGVSIVALGSFNPRIFQPAWLVQHGLVPEGEAEAARFEMFDRELMQLGLPWAEMLVRPDRLQIQSLEELTDPGQIRDLAIGIMTLLPHTPVSRLGINVWGHYRVASMEVWHEIGHRLTPKDLWSEVLDHPGMLKVEIQGTRSDDREGAINVIVQPSGEVTPGVFINVNDDVLFEEARATAHGAQKALAEMWEPAQTRADAVMNRVMSLAREIAA